MFLTIANTVEMFLAIPNTVEMFLTKVTKYGRKVPLTLYIYICIFLCVRSMLREMSQGVSESVAILALQVFDKAQAQNFELPGLRGSSKHSLAAVSHSMSIALSSSDKKRAAPPATPSPAISEHLEGQAALQISNSTLAFRSHFLGQQ